MTDTTTDQRGSKPGCLCFLSVCIHGDGRAPQRLQLTARFLPQRLAPGWREMCVWSFFFLGGGGALEVIEVSHIECFVLICDFLMVGQHHRCINEPRGQIYFLHLHRAPWPASFLLPLCQHNAGLEEHRCQRWWEEAVLLVLLPPNHRPSLKRNAAKNV